MAKKKSNNREKTNNKTEIINYSVFFQDLESSKNENELLQLFSKYNLEGIDREKYPLIKYTIKEGEIKKLQNEGKITNEYKFNLTLAEDDNLSPLEKILYSMIWKNGDLGKEAHIISGVLGLKRKDEKRGIVYKQLGKHLNKKDEIVIDQHVIRAYIFHKTENIKKNIYPTDCYKYLDDYKTWINGNKLFRENKRIIDELLFSLGQRMKEEKKAVGKTNP
jgi:hypothetical protein